MTSRSPKRRNYDNLGPKEKGPRLSTCLIDFLVC